MWLLAVLLGGRINKGFCEHFARPKKVAVVTKLVTVLLRWP